MAAWLRTNGFVYSADADDWYTNGHFCCFGCLLTVFDNWYTVGTVLVDLWRLVHQWFRVFLTIGTVYHSSKTVKNSQKTVKQQKWPLVYQSSHVYTESAEYTKSASASASASAECTKPFVCTGIHVPTYITETPCSSMYRIASGDSVTSKV